MIADGVNTFVEVGPGKSLSSFLKKIDKNVKSINIDSIAALEQYLQLAYA